MSMKRKEKRAGHRVDIRVILFRAVSRTLFLSLMQNCFPFSLKRSNFSTRDSISYRRAGSIPPRNGQLRNALCGKSLVSHRTYYPYYYNSEHIFMMDTGGII